MQAAGRGIASYLELFRKRRADLLNRGEVAGYDRQVATTWSLAFAELGQDGRAARLLRLVACCAAEDIPLDLLLQPCPELETTLGPLLDDELVRDEAVAGLRRYSLISAPRDARVSVHRLVQAITLDRLTEEDRIAWRTAAATAIEAALPSDAQDPAGWPIYEALLPHAQATLDPAGNGMLRIAQYLGYTGNYAVARDLVRPLLQAREMTWGVEHQDTLSAHANLAFWIGQAGDPAAARDQYAALLPVSERVLGAEHPDTLTLRSNHDYWTRLDNDQPGGAGG